jgi:translation initiation factor 4G
MHECVKNLLGNVDNPEEVESLCKLLMTVGNSLDTTQKVQAHTDVYFFRMKELSKRTHVTSHMQFMFQVCISIILQFSCLIIIFETVLICVDHVLHLAV